MLLKMGKHIRRIRQSITDITKMNSLYLEEKTKNGFNRNGRTYSIPKLKLKRNNTTDEIFSNNSKTVYNNYDVSSMDKDYQGDLQSEQSIDNLDDMLEEFIEELFDDIDFDN